MTLLKIRSMYGVPLIICSRATLNAVQVLEQILTLKEQDNMTHMFEGVGVALATPLPIMRLISTH